MLFPIHRSVTEWITFGDGEEDPEEPITFADALASPNSREWMTAMEEGMDSLKKNGTWMLTNIPPGRTAIINRWIFKVKSDGRFKAQLVAKGFTQRPGIDYAETFSPLVKHVTTSFAIHRSSKRSRNGTT